jgi:hypothetical protein
MKSTIWLAMVMCGVAVSWAAASTRWGSADNSKSEPNFAPKVLMIYCKDKDLNTVLADVSVQQLGGRAFFVGKVLSHDGSPTTWNKAKQWVAIDSVVSMYEFSSVEDARKAHLEALKKKAE